MHIKNASISYDQTPCIEERGYFGTVKLEKNFANDARNTLLRGIETNAQKAETYLKADKDTTLIQVDEKFRYERHVDIKLERLHESPILSYEPGDISIEIKEKNKNFDDYV